MKSNMIIWNSNAKTKHSGPAKTNHLLKKQITHSKNQSSDQWLLVSGHPGTCMWPVQHGIIDYVHDVNFGVYFRLSVTVFYERASEWQAREQVSDRPARSPCAKFWWLPPTTVLELDFWSNELSLARLTSFVWCYQRFQIKSSFQQRPILYETLLFHRYWF